MWGEERKVTEKKATFIEHILSCSCLVAQSCLTLCNPMNYNMPGFPFLHHLPEFAQTHVHWVNDPIQPFYPWSSSPDLNFSSIWVFANERKNKTNKQKTKIYWAHTKYCLTKCLDFSVTSYRNTQMNFLANLILNISHMLFNINILLRLKRIVSTSDVLLLHYKNVELEGIKQHIWSSCGIWILINLIRCKILQSFQESTWLMQSELGTGSWALSQGWPGGTENHNLWF